MHPCLEVDKGGMADQGISHSGEVRRQNHYFLFLRHVDICYTLLSLYLVPALSMRHNEQYQRNDSSLLCAIHVIKL